MPSIAPDRFSQIGNAAGLGARLALASEQERETAGKLARDASYLELAGHKAFMRAFIGRINFDPLEPSRQHNTILEKV